MTATRRLAAILNADVAGYSRLMGANEEGTLERLKALRSELLNPKIAEHHGRTVKTTGDGMLVEFASAVDAVRCAVEVQKAMPERNSGIGGDDHIQLRIGISLGDVIVEGDDLYGDGVNIAARLEALADPGGVFISNTVHDQVRDRLPFVFEDLGENQVKNIARPVGVYRIRDAAVAKATSPQPSLPLPDKPSIAVLRRIRWLFVIARNSSFTYKGQNIDVKQVGRELGVRYVLEGSVRRAGQRVRITGQLIVAASGTHLWADRFDGSLEDVFDLQDKVASSVAGVIEPALETSEIRRSERRPTHDLDAYDLYLRALPILFAFPSPERVRDALGFLDQAIARDPRYGPALALAAVGHARLYDWGEDVETNQEKGITRARLAVESAGDDPGVLALAAFPLSFLGEDIATQIELADRALVLNPSFSASLVFAGRSGCVGRGA